MISIMSTKTSNKAEKPASAPSNHSDAPPEEEMSQKDEPSEKGGQKGLSRHAMVTGSQVGAVLIFKAFSWVN